ncbi:MAG TPA: hypothetical protein VMR00_07515 [Streptosporangiaceae bacterium]|nr:hypothetical protein [Streptosporangiaceae bacterium]
MDADGDDVVAEGQCCVEGVLGELADAADRHDHQAFGRQRAVRVPAQVEFESEHAVAVHRPLGPQAEQVG